MPDRDPIVGPLEVQLGDETRLIGINYDLRIVAEKSGRKWNLWLRPVEGKSRGRLLASCPTIFGLDALCDALALARDELLKPEMAHG
jgi:hypothetical protein